MNLQPTIGLGSSVGGFSPATLFAASEPGVWFDPSDLTTMFQDTAGTVPVTAAGQTVARINDKSGRGNHATQSTAASRPTYQVDSTGRPFLLFDGSDDFLVTGTITPGIDKMQVFAGARKLSDASSGLLCELSTGSGAGRFELFAPLGAGLANYQFRSQGTATTSNTVTSFAAPITNVVTGIGDISGDANIVRVNGAQVGSVSTDQGTGNYLAYAFYVGRRAGTTSPFNGRIYNLITRFGSNLSAAQIAAAEAWVNGKTGAF